jgi:hypothetical protein
VVRVTLSFDKVEVVGLVSVEVGMMEDMVRTSFEFSLVEVVHVQLSYE